MKNFYSIVGTLLFIAVLYSQVSTGQTTLIDESFESGNVLTLVNGTQTNQFVRNTAVAQAGSYSLYITNNTGGAPPPNSYTLTGASVVHAYKDVAIPSGETDIQLTFWIKGIGESTFDRLRVYDVATSTAITAGTELSSGQIGLVNYNAQGEWIRCGVLLPSGEAGTSRRIVFSWRNDGSVGYDPPIAIDNIKLISRTPSALSGTYTIDNTTATGGTNFNDFVDAILRLNSDGVSSAVTFNVTSGQTYYNLNPVITATGTVSNTITFQKSGGSSNPIIKTGGQSSTTPIDAGISIAGGDYFTFDGIDIQATTNATYAYVDAGYYIYNASATNGAQNNTIKNSKITLNRINTSSIGIYQTYITSPTSTAGANSYNKFYNLIIENVYNGIYLLGLSAYPDINTEIGITGSGTTTIGGSTSNDIGNGSATTYGIRVAQQQNIKIFNCEVRNVTNTGSSNNIHGIFLDGLKGTTNFVYNNNIHDIKNSNTLNGSTVTGIRSDVATGVIVNIYNNFVSAISHSSTTVSSTQYVRGIACNLASGVGTVNLYDNSVRIETSLYISSTAFYTQSGTANTKDNIFSNFSATGATSKRYCIYVSSGTLNNSNYNDFYINTSGTGNNVGYYNSADRNTLANWQTATSKDGNSKNVNPSFATSTDLHSSSTDLNGAGVTISTAGGDALDITTDIDGNTRGTPPDIGADEFNINDFTSKAEAPASQVAAGNVASTVTTVGAAVDVFRFKITDMGSGDGLATKVSNIRIQNANPANGASWTANIAGLKLNDGTSDITIGTPTITSSYIDIPITSGNLDVADASSKTITMAIYLKTSGIEDGKKLQFTIPATSHGFTAYGTGSLFAADFGAAVTGNEQTITVTATKLVFTSVPANVLVSINFSSTVTASDANGNTDIDNTTSVTIAKNTGTGTLSSTTGLTQSLVNGTKTWSDLQYNAMETFKIQADGGSLIQAVSGNIVCSNTVIVGTSTAASQSYPFDVYYGYSRNAGLYLQSEIGAYFTLSKLSWQIATAQITNCPVKVYLKKTTATTITADTWSNMISGATLVYDGTVQFTPTGWFDIVFSSSFNYDSDNLLVLTEGNYGGSGTGTYPTFFYTAATNMNANQRQDSSPPSGNLSVGSSRPNLKMTLPVPKSLSGITYNQASIDPVTTGSLNQQILRLDFTVAGSTGTLYLNSIVVSSNNDDDNDIANVKLFRTSSATFNTTNQLGTTQTFSSGNATFSSLSYDLPEGTTYVWVAYDIDENATNNHLADAKITANNIDVAGNTYPSSDQSPAGSRIIKAPLAGDYYIGTSTKGDYTTLTAAVSDLNTLGISGSVNFILTDATYLDETKPIYIYPITGASVTKTLTIKPGTDVNATISSSSSSGVIAFLGCDYVTIDGSNSGGTDRSLTIENTYSGSNTYVIGFFSNGGTDGAKYCTVKNTNIKATGELTNAQFGIMMNSTGGDYDNAVIDNNKIYKTRTGIQFAGVSGGITNDGQITNNIIGDASEPITYTGLSVSYADNTLISGNEIFGNASGNTNYTQCGIVLGIPGSLGTGPTATKIRNNNIHDFYYTGTTGYGCFGIYFYSTATSVSEITNNVIYNIKGGGDPAQTYWNSSGIYLQAGGNIHIYYNSIYMSGDVLGAGSYNGWGACISLSGDIVLLDIRNNNLRNSMGRVSGATTSPLLYIIYSGSGNTAYTDINYNNYFYTNQPNVTELLGYLGSNRVDLSAWQTATGKDANSYSTNPYFSATDNLKPTTGGYLIGTEISSITTDIEGTTRSNPPDIGAYEGTEAGRWLGCTSTDWTTGSNWDNGAQATSSDDVVISSWAQYKPHVTLGTSTPAECNNLTINPGAKLTIDAGKALTVNGTLTNSAGEAGLIIKSNATGTGSLISSTANVDVRVERFLTKMKWHFIGMPVESAVAGVFHLSSGHSDIWLRPHDETTNTWGEEIIPVETPLALGKGYECWVGDDSYNNDETIVFPGQLNAGDLTTGSGGFYGLTYSGTGYNFISNPYPSALEGNVDTWTKTNVDNSIWVWQGTGTGMEGGGNYLTWNGTIGTLTGGIIPAMQGFFVHANNSGASVTLPQSSRVHDSQLYYKDSDLPLNTLRLDVKGNECYDAVFVSFNDQATEGYDPQFDVRKMFGVFQAPQLYTMVPENELSINVLPEMSEDKTVAIGFECGLPSTFTIEATGLDGFEYTTGIYLEDLKEEVIQDLRENPICVFSNEMGDEPGRFLLHFNYNMDVPENPFGSDGINVYAYQENVYITSLSGVKGTVVIYDLVGKEIVRGSLNGESYKKIRINDFSGFAVATVVWDNGSLIKKVYIQ